MSAHPRTLAAEIHDATGVNAATCYQCGKCSAGCPMASESDLRPHNVMRLVIQDRRDKALADQSIWLCLTCETCSARCPNACDPARVIDALREMSLDAGVADLPRTIGARMVRFTPLPIAAMPSTIWGACWLFISLPQL